MTLLTDRQEKMIINNVVKACKDIDNLNNTGYKYINLCSGFIAHYNLYGFKDYYTERSLKADILDFKRNNQWNNFRENERGYDYYMQKKRVYNAICERIK